MQELTRMPPGNQRGQGSYDYQRVDTGDGAVLLKGASTRRSQTSCIDTEGRFFNLLVALVLCANAVFLCVEADLDLLGADAQKWDGQTVMGGPWASKATGTINIAPITQTPKAGANSQHWGGLESDMGLIGINNKQQAGIETDIQEGLSADHGLKASVQQDVNSIAHENVNVGKDFKSGAYSAIELLFVVLYFLELCCRLYDVGCAGFCKDAWSVVDVTVVIAGLVDLTIPVITTLSTSSPVEQVLRLLRVLRIVRLFRVCAELRGIGRAFLNAFYAVVWVFALIFIINLVCAVFLTTFVGQRAHLWDDHAEQVHAWFGSVGRSMVTLTEIMTLSGWDHIAEVLIHVIPRLAVMCTMFVYVLACCFTMMGLIAGLINTFFASTQLEQDKLSAQRTRERRAAFASAFADILATYELSSDGYLSRQEYSAVLESNPVLLVEFQMLGMGSSDGLLQLYDRLSQDPSFNGVVKMTHLVEAATLLGGTADASAVFDLNYQILGLRRDVLASSKEMGMKHERIMASTESRLEERVMKMQDSISAVKHEVSSLCKVVSTVTQQVELLGSDGIKDRCRQGDAFIATNSKLDTVYSQLNSTLFALTSRVAAQSGIVDKVEALASQVAMQGGLVVQLSTTQAAVHEKVDALTTQLCPGPFDRLWPLYEAKMKKGGKESETTAAIDAFKHNFSVLASGASTMIPESMIEHVSPLPELAKLSITAKPELLHKTEIVKLNGGLGTGMGLEKAKSLLRVAGEHTFLDLIAKQVEWMKTEYNQPDLHFMLMNSFATSEDTKALLSKYPALGSGPDLEFVQNKAPKVAADDLSPADYPADRDLEWCPPGHGDLYAAMLGSGTLEKLLGKGMKYMFVSNSDNLGATMDLELLTYFADSGAPFMMEVATRTDADRKGGHLATVRKTGGLTLRESAQCDKEDEAAFQDVSKYAYFNTNNLWIDLEQLKVLFDKHGGTIPLPVIRNEKTVDPRDKMSAKVFQLETAMGAAISCFDTATAVLVPRTRFSPVKKCDDLLAMRSDAYVLTPDFRMELAPERKGVPPLVKLDDMYKFVDAMDTLIPNGVPSLKDCKSLSIEGPMEFAAGVVIQGDVKIKSTEKKQVPKGTYKDQTLEL